MMCKSIKNYNNLGIPIRESLIPDTIIFHENMISAPRKVIQKWKWSYGKLGFVSAMKGCEIFRMDENGVKLIKKNMHQFFYKNLAEESYNGFFRNRETNQKFYV